MGRTNVDAQTPVMRFAVYDGQKPVDPLDNEYEVWLGFGDGKEPKTSESSHANLLRTYDANTALLPWAYAHEIPGPTYLYHFNICHGYDTMTVHIKTWFVDWNTANFLISYQPGTWCFDMREARDAHEGIAPLDIRPYLVPQPEKGDCFPED